MLWQKLDQYQRDAVNHCLAIKTAAVYMEQGTGKTWVAAGLIEALKCMNALIVVPLTNLESTWLKILSLNFPGLPIARSWEDYRSGILLLHFEALPKYIKKIRKHKWQLIVIDESQRLAHRNTLQSRTAAKLHDSAEYKVLLTGTPFEDDPQGLWAQFRFLARGVLPDKWKDFEDQYFEPIDEGLTLKGIRYGTMKWRRMMKLMLIAKRKRHFDLEKLDDFLELLAPYIFELQLDDVLDLPVQVHRVPVAMHGRQRRMYDELERRLILELKESSVSAPLKITQLIKLQQITGGYVIDDDGETHEVGRCKLNALVRLLKEHRGPYTIFARYRAEVEAIRKALDEDDYIVRVMTGKTKKKDRLTIQNDFQAGKLDAVISQVRVGGVGIDLFRSNILVLYSMGHSSIDFRQVVARLRRRGQKKKVHVFILEIFDTIDNEFYDSVKAKRRVIDQVTDRLRLVNRKRRVITWQRKSPRRKCRSASRNSPSTSASSRRQLASR